jgi:hypothetical protein
VLFRHIDVVLIPNDASAKIMGPAFEHGAAHLPYEQQQKQDDRYSLFFCKSILMSLYSPRLLRYA